LEKIVLRKLLIYLKLDKITKADLSILLPLRFKKKKKTHILYSPFEIVIFEWGRA
jgi:hypothetical protein